MLQRKGDIAAISVVDGSQLWSTPLESSGKKFNPLAIALSPDRALIAIGGRKGIQMLTSEGRVLLE